MTQWLISIFVPFKLQDITISYCGSGKDELFLTSQSSLLFVCEELQIHGYCHVRFDKYCDGLGCWSFLQWCE